MLQQLMTIEDLHKIDEESMTEILQAAKKLSGIYFEFITTDRGDYKYEVFVGGEEERASGIHASEVSKCFRQLVYSLSDYKRVKREAEANMRMRFRLGHAVHAMVQSDWHRIAKSGIPEKHGIKIEFEDEAKISPALKGVAEIWDIHSHCDGVFIIYKRVGEEWVPWFRLAMEIKTASEKEYEKLRKPYDDHMEQTCIYLAALDVPLMWTFYYNKSNSNITTSFSPWLFRFDSDLWEKLEMRFAKAHHYSDTGQLPEREEGFHCNWCPFGWDCQPKILNRKKRGAPPKMRPGMLPSGMLPRKK